MTETMAAAVIILLSAFGIVTSQVTYECPSNWYTFSGFCYKFEADVPATYDNARATCNLNGAGVLSLDNIPESTFIAQWLQTNDKFQREWYTSGVPDTTVRAVDTGTGFIWESTGQPMQPLLTSLWIDPIDNTTTPKGVIIYKYGKTGPGLALGDGAIVRPYICKISMQEAYRILLTDRGFDYGLINPDLANLEQGPHFIVQPHSVVVIIRDDNTAEPVNLECVVQAIPQATYRWFKGQKLEKEITDQVDARYAITNGKLTITSPVEVKDSDRYQCRAENKFGIVVSSVVEVTFGSMGQFNNVPDAGTRGKAYEGAQVECSKLIYKPAINYQWIKGSDQQFVRPQYQTYIFISNNGKLYFSEVTRTDAAEYKCVAILTGVNRFTIGTSQPPMRTSLPIPLIIDDQAPLSEWGPAIQNDFIAVFPKPPLRGQDIRLECFAYGSSTSSFYYTWSREDKPMPATAIISDSNRVLTIKEAQLEDSGVYRCSVSRGNQGDTKTVTLDLGAAPYFVSPLRDQHVDINAQLTWICIARANPAPTYQWYKNGVPISAQNSAGITIQKNVLTISKLDPDQHNGMYQCGAENTYGSSLSNAQLRVLSFAPNINKYPPPSSIMASNGGNITLRCQPEGSPFPTITWTKDGGAITSDNAKYTVYANGNLHITGLTQGDRGVYTCKAVNDNGQAEASTKMEITTGASITMAPADQSAVVNRTVFLVCEASFPKDVDMIYDWTFNTYPLFYDLIHFRQVQDSSPGTNGLYILNANFDHEGEYTCTARTPFNSEARKAYLKISGPPRQPAGVYILPETVTQNSATVIWTTGSPSGGTVSVHIVQASNEFEVGVWEDMLTITVADSYRQDAIVKDKHQGNVTGLNPGVGYRLRIIAQNEYGLGIPSDPSLYFQTVSAPPRVSPNNVRGGGGKVGDLTMRWDALKRAEYGAQDNSVGYRIHWRKKDENVQDAVWNLLIVTDATQDYVVTQVGAQYYFLLYEVKVQAYNSAGFGPNSTIVEIYSAEELPIGSPTGVNTNTHNSSCIEVYWTPVPDDRVHARGQILGYVINYWNEEFDPNTDTQSIRYYGNVDNGLVIGLESQVNTVVDVQAYNSAGLGPRSNTYIMETARLPALHYSEEVRIGSAGFGRARVWWRGVTTAQIEEDITGWLIWLWTASEDWRAAKEIQINERSAVMYTIHNISEHRLYALRIAATSFGGIGKKSPTIYFTTEGQILIDSRFAETIQAYESDGIKQSFSLLVLITCSLIVFLQRLSS